MRDCVLTVEAYINMSAFYVFKAFWMHAIINKTIKRIIIIWNELKIIKQRLWRQYQKGHNNNNKEQQQRGRNRCGLNTNTRQRAIVSRAPNELPSFFRLSFFHSLSWGPKRPNLKRILGFYTHSHIHTHSHKHTPTRTHSHIHSHTHAIPLPVTYNPL